MGEYAYFVWPCYGAVVVVLMVFGFLSWKDKKSDEKQLKVLQDQLNILEKQD